MFKVTVDHAGVARLTAKLKGLKGKIPRAAAIALNETGKQEISALQEQMKKDFDKPTPYTLNSLFATKATPEILVVTILPREFAGKGTPAKKYLGPQIFGGDRGQKRFEKALQARGVLPQGMYAYPGSGATKDAYGNMPGSQIVQILSYFQAFGEQGYRANMDVKGRARLAKGSRKRGFGFEYFAVRRKRGGLVPGVWKRTNFRSFGKAVSPILIFGTKPVYTRRYRWHEIAQRTAERQWLYNFRRALVEQLEK